jgi:hypothetical protein
MHVFVVGVLGVNNILIIRSLIRRDVSLISKNVKIENGFGPGSGPAAVDLSSGPLLQTLWLCAVQIPEDHRSTLKQDLRKFKFQGA